MGIYQQILLGLEKKNYDNDGYYFYYCGNIDFFVCGGMDLHIPLSLSSAKGIAELR